MKRTIAFAVSIFMAPVALLADTVYLNCEVKKSSRGAMAESVESLLGDTSAFTVSLNEGTGSINHNYTSPSRIKDFRATGVFGLSSVEYSWSVPYHLGGSLRIRITKEISIDRSNLDAQVITVVRESNRLLPAYTEQGKCTIVDVGRTRKF